MSAGTWNRCNYCGRFISFADFEAGAALRRMYHVYLEWAGDVDEVYETYHVACKQVPEVTRG